MNLAAARIFVPDVAAAKTFYQSLLGLRLKSDGIDDGFCVFDAGDIDLVIESVPDDAPEEDRELVGRFTGLSFRVHDLAAQYVRLRAAGVRFPGGAPAAQSWGGLLTTLRDPAGNEIQLVQYPAK